MTSLLEDLRSALERPDVLLLLGAGISVGATSGDACASWIGLLLNGVDRCLAVGAIPHGKWEETIRNQIDSDDPFSLVLAAEDICHRLGDATGGEYGEWLRTTIGSLDLGDSAVIDALGALQRQIATTNYDSLIEQRLGLSPVTWLDKTRVQRLFRGDDRAVLHLHGHWETPESVVLGIRSYDQILRDEASQLVLKHCLWGRTIVFVGFGQGLSDPNFAELLKWSRKHLSGSEYRHYRLVLDSEVEATKKQHADDRIAVVPYGSSHSDLQDFLRRLARPASAEQRMNPPPSSSDPFSRLAELRSQESSLSADEFIGRLRNLTVELWRSGYRRTAWTILSSPFDRRRAEFAQSVRIDVGVELAAMMLQDGAGDRAQSELQALADDANQLPEEDKLKLAFFELQARVFADLAGYDDAVVGIERALAAAQGELRHVLRARLAEMHLLRGAVGEAQNVSGAEEDD